jgi:hypothetical protein
MLQVQRLPDNDHAAIGIDHPRVRIDGYSFPCVEVPFKANGNAGVHAGSAATLISARAELFRFMSLYGHNFLYQAMLELSRKTVNGT